MTQTDNIFKNDVNHYDILFENAYDPMTILKGQYFVDANKAVIKLLKMSSKDEVYKLHPSQISPEYQPDGRRSDEKADEMIGMCYKNGVHRFDWLHKKLDGEEFLVEITLKKIIINDEDLIYVTWNDITERKEIENELLKKNTELLKNNNFIKSVNSVLKNQDQSKGSMLDSLLLLEEYKKVIDESAIVSKTDRYGNITYANDIFCEVSGYSKKELMGKNHNIIRHSDNSISIYKDLWETITNKKIFKGILKNKKKDGSAYYVDSTIMPILDKNENVIEYIAIRYDITSLYEKDEIIYKQFTDDLTKLSNRQKLLSEIDVLPNPCLAVLNIDRFTDINESYGLDFGDDVLKEVAKDLTNLKRTNFNIYRISGDIYAILSYGNVSLDDLYHYCTDLSEYFNKKVFKLKDNNIEISFTMGIAPQSDKILSNAEMAVTHAKQNNKDIVVYDETIDVGKQLKENIELTKEIKQAIKNDNILLYAQKITNNITKVVKYETLMRLKKEDGSIMSPFFFLEQAKKARLYPNMTKIMIEKACNYFEGKNIIFSLNLTLQDIINRDTIEFLINTIKNKKLEKLVVLEIVESEGIEVFKEVSEFISKMKEIGCLIAIDDFGTGYSNFEYLIQLDVDILKIDGSLIKNIHIDQNIYTTVSTIVDFAKSLNIEIVAEYVHCKEVQDIVEELGIDYSQGFFLHEPEHFVND